MMPRHLLFILSTLFLLSHSVRAEVIINEIFYNSPADLDRLEYVELHNTSPKPVSIEEWTFTRGIEYKFAKDTTIEAGGFLVLCGDKELFKEFYGIDAHDVFAKGLDNGGETITLKDADGKNIDSVKYKDKAPWPKSADGYSASLERICPTAESNNALNWAPSVLSDNYDSDPSGTPGTQNSAYAATLPPVIDAVTFTPEISMPNESVTVTTKIDDASLTEAILSYRIAAPGAEEEETSITMKLGTDNTYTATIPGAKANRIIRFRVKAVNKDGDARYFPHENAIRPALSVYVNGGFQPGSIPVAQFFNVGEAEFKAGADYRTSHSQSHGRSFGGREERERREPSPEERLRRSTEERLSENSLQKALAEISLKQGLPDKALLPVSKALQTANKTLSDLRRTARETKDISAFSEELDTQLTSLRNVLKEGTTGHLTEAQQEAFAATGVETQREERGPGGRGFGNLTEMLPRLFNVEGSWFRCAMIEGLSEDQLGKLATMHRKAIEDRSKLVAGEDIDFRAVFEAARDLQENLRNEAGKALNEDQLVTAFGRSRGGGDRGDRRRGGPDLGRRGGAQEGPALRPQGRSAFIYTSPETKQPQLFDFVNITQRKSGYKVRLHKDKPLNGMTTINVLYERNEGTTLNEALAYELYRQAGNAAAEAGFVRVMIDGELAGYHLWFEQPNGNFFRRNEINAKGNLYKLIWMGSHRPSKRTPKDKLPERMDIVGKHEKKTNPHDGYEDIISLIEALENAQGDDNKMWQLIQDNFDVDQVINYFAVNSLLSHWDGFFNNYFLYHDVKASGKWSLYPWDQDSTWSLRMGNAQELSTMPINFGAEGARPAGAEPRRDDDSDRRGRGGFRGFGGGRGDPGWWRDGGDISKPLLANPQFYQRFKARLKTLAETTFTEDNFGPDIDAVAKSIEPEVRLRAKTFNRDPDTAAREFQDTMAQMRQHMKLRTAFILQELANE